VGCRAAVSAVPVRPSILRSSVAIVTFILLAHSLKLFDLKE
jgi:hypothetical protein